MLPATAEFFDAYTARDGSRALLSYCNGCRRSQKRVYSKTTKGRRVGREAQRRYMLKYVYGMTPAAYEELLLKQNHACAICCQPETLVDPRYGTVRELAVDHDHETKAVRGLLCQQCNTGIGSLKHSVARLHNAARYLASHGTTQAFDAGE